MDIPHANSYRNQGRTHQRRPTQCNYANNNQYRENEDRRFYSEEFIVGVATGVVMLKVFQKHPIISVVSVGLTAGLYFSKE